VNLELVFGDASERPSPSPSSKRVEAPLAIALRDGRAGVGRRQGIPRMRRDNGADLPAERAGDEHVDQQECDLLVHPRFLWPPNAV